MTNINSMPSTGTKMRRKKKKQETPARVVKMSISTKCTCTTLGQLYRLGISDLRELMIIFHLLSRASKLKEEEGNNKLLNNIESNLRMTELVSLICNR
jgi:hypothetical protein